jgi:uncharacterized Fe-S radical SAM superfamily protein PflX
MKIQIEQLTPDLFDELMPMGQKLWDECSEIKKDTCSFHGERGLKIQPNRTIYLALQANNQLSVFVLRGGDGVALGFSFCIFYNSMHHEVVPCVNVDLFYIEPERRSSIKRLINLMEDEFRQRGVVVVGWPISPMGKLFEILKTLGYAPDDVVLEKRICALQQQ